MVTTRHVGLKILEIPSCPLGNLIVSGFKQGTCSCSCARCLSQSRAQCFACSKAGPPHVARLRAHLRADPSQPPQVKTPAETAGVQVGDVLVSISDTLVAYMTYDDMAEVLGKAQRPAKFVFARHTMPFNPESARPENIILKQVWLAWRLALLPFAPRVSCCSGCSPDGAVPTPARDARVFAGAQATMLKKGKHFFNVIEHERNFLATLKYLTFVGSKTHAKEVLVSTMTALRHDDERIYVETTSRNYKFRCKSSADKSEWLYSFLCALYLQGNVTSYVNGELCGRHHCAMLRPLLHVLCIYFVAINMINNPALLTADADGLPATPAAAGGAAAPGASGAAATDHRAYELTAVPEESVLSAPAPPVSTTAPSAASSDSEEESDSDDDAPADATPPTKAIPVPVAKPTGPPPPARTPQGISVPISARMAPPQVAAAQKKVVIHVPPPTSPPGRPAPRPAAVVVEVCENTTSCCVCCILSLVFTLSSAVRLIVCV